MVEHFILTHDGDTVTAQRAEQHLSNKMFSRFGEVGLAELPIEEIVRAIVERVKA